MIASPEEFRAAFGVSRETTERLAAYASTLTKWNRRINLIAGSTTRDIWHRHFADSAQLIRAAHSRTGMWADLGSGAGFPGLVVAILALEHAQGLSMCLVESDTRKCAFLTAAAEAAGIAVRILPVRAEILPPLGADIVSARALAPLSKLYPLAIRHLRPDGRCLFLKGRTVESELTAVRRVWNSSIETFPSLTDENGVVLRIGDIKRA